ncbi:hypothetical protein Vretimale_6595, partial [Volvox reticuliferus]
MSGLTSLRGIPPPGARRSVPDSGGEPLSSLSDAPPLSGNKPKPTFRDDDDDFSGLGPPTFSKPGRAPSVKSSVRKSTPNPQTARFDDDEDSPKVTAKKGVHFAKSTSEKRGIKSPFGNDDDDDFPKARKSSAFKNPFSDDEEKPSGRRGGVSASTSSVVKPSASNPAFKWDDDSPPRGSTGLGKSGAAGKSPWDDDDDPILKKSDEPFTRSTVGGVRSSVSKPTGKSPDDIFGMMKDDPPPVTADLGLDLFGATASKPAAGPRAGRRAAGSVQQSMTDLSPEISREPTPEPSRPAMSPEPSSAPRPGLEASTGFERSRSTPRGSSIGDEFGEAPVRSAASAIGGPRARGSETGPSVTTLMGGEASSTSPPSRVTRPSGGVGGGMELDVDDLPGIGSPAILSKNPSTASVQGAATAAAAVPPAGRRTSPATGAAKSLKNDDSWEVDDNLLPDDSNNPAPKSPPLATASSGYTPSAAEAPGKSRLQHTTFGGQKKEDEPQDDEEPAAGSSYTPSFGRRQSAGSGLFGGGLGVNPNPTAASVDSSGLLGSALNPGGPGAPRPRRQMGASTDASPMGSLTGSGFGSAAAAKPGGPQPKKTKDEEERERVAKAMAEAAARRQQRLATGPIRLPGQDPPAPTAPLSPVGGAGSNRGTDSGLVPTPTSPSPVRPGAGGKPGVGGFGKKTPGLGFSSDSSDDDVPQPDKAISPPLPTMTARKAAAGAAGHQPTRATTTGPLARDAAAFDSRVASSVPEMGAAAAAAALGAVPGPGPGSIMQSSAPAPPLLPEASYPHSVGSQPSAPSVGPVPSQTPLPERSGTSSASQPSAVGLHTVIGGGLPLGNMPTLPQPSQVQGGVSQTAMQ